MAIRPNSPAWRAAMDWETRARKQRDETNARARAKYAAAKPAREAAKAARLVAMHARLLAMYEQAAYEEQAERDARESV